MRWLRRRKERDSRYDCPHCGGFLETGMPNPHAARVHLREFCDALDPIEAGRQIREILRKYDRAQGR
jgi:hypothetical protein